MIAKTGFDSGSAQSYLLGMLRKRIPLKASTARAFETGDRVMMHSLDATRIWRGTVLEYDPPDDCYRVEWDDDFVSTVQPCRLEADRG
jgi:hypothetical protein